MDFYARLLRKVESLAVRGESVKGNLGNFARRSSSRPSTAPEMLDDLLNTTVKGILQGLL